MSLSVDVARPNERSQSDPLSTRNDETGAAELRSLLVLIGPVDLVALEVIVQLLRRVGVLESTEARKCKQG